MKDVFRVKMSAQFEESFGHFTPEERIRHADYLEQLVRQLRMSAKVAIGDRAPRVRNPLRPLCRAKLVRN